MAGVIATAVALSAAAKADDNAETLEVSIRSASVVAMPAQGWRGAAVAQLSHRVSFADLDLARQADAAQLKERIDRTAQLICTRLGELYPAASPAREVTARASCVKDAVDGAMAQVQYRLAAQQTRERG